MAVAIEDAGFIIHPMIGWVYGCLDETSEILTENGWKKGVEVQKGDKVATWNPETEEIILDFVLDTTKGYYSGKMIHFINDNTDQLLTPNHRVYQKSRKRKQRYGKRRRWFDKEWNIRLAGSIETWNPIKLPLSGYHSGLGIGGEDYARLLGWVWTEGGYDSEEGYTGVRIYQSSVNMEHVEEIRALIRKLIPAHKEYSRKRKYKDRDYTEYMWYFSGKPAMQVRESLPEKHPNWPLLWQMTQEEKLAFLDASMKGDGSGMGFYQKDYQDKRWFQVLLHLVGMQGRIYDKRICVHLHDNPTTEFQGRHMQNMAKDYSGYIWCVKVSTGAFMARRNGRIFITGNSGFPKATRVKGHEEFDGHRYGTQALKPALEPIIVFQKPYEGKPVENIVESGAGVLNIDAGRIGVGDELISEPQSDPSRREGVVGTDLGISNADVEKFQKAQRDSVEQMKAKGRWPANFLLTHAPDCQIVGYKDQEAYQINRFTDGAKPFGDGAGHEFETEEIEGGKVPVWECVEGCPVEALDKQSGKLTSGKIEKHHILAQESWKQSSGKTTGLESYGDSGGASRFFHQSSWAFENADPFIYQAKVSPSERNAGLEERCVHPTLKPIALCVHLASLLLPPKEKAPRRLLVPFAGTGSEMIGAFQAGWDCAIGIELEREYVDIGRQRIKYWLSQGIQLSLL
jgi:hypothetical protein